MEAQLSELDSKDLEDVVSLTTGQIDLKLSAIEGKFKTFSRSFGSPAECVELRKEMQILDSAIDFELDTFLRVIASLNGQSMSTTNHYLRHYNRIGVETGLAAVQQTLTKTLHRYSYEAKLTFDRFRTWVQECGAGNSNISEQKIVDVEGELFAA